MLCAAAGRLCPRIVASTLPRGCLPKMKYSIVLASLKSTNRLGHVEFSRHFSSTSIRYHMPTNEAAAAATVAQSSSNAASPTGAVAEKIVDISSTSEVTIPQLAEGLSSDLLVASGINPTLQDMGLGSYFTPSGLLQNTLDIVHNVGLPWWATIGVVTLMLKTLMVPVVIKCLRNATIMNNNLPEMQRLQLKMSEARRSGNMLEASRAASELALFMKEKDVNVFKSLVPMLVQGPVFISFFVALKGMANLPIESLKTGGLWWFADLSLPDPYYILPLITCSSVLIMFETGADGAIRADNMKNMKYFIRALPVVMFPFIMNFPAAILCYWSTSNLFSLGQTILFRRPLIREKFNIPPLVKHPRSDLPLSRGFVKDIKESYNNVKISQEIGNRARSDEILFKQAGLGPVVKTFKHPQKLKQQANN